MIKDLVAKRIAADEVFKNHAFNIAKDQYMMHINKD